jgi:hypothetical protein
MYPWHMLVCESAKVGLLDAALRFVRDYGQRHQVDGPRDLPNRVIRLIELGDQKRTADHPSYLDDAFWYGEGESPDEDVSGLIVLRDYGIRPVMARTLQGARGGRGCPSKPSLALKASCELVAPSLNPSLRRPASVT